MKLATNGKASSGKRTRHINIRYFFVTDRIKSEEMRVEYCPSELLIADFYTKPLQGGLFRQFRNFILNIDEPQFSEFNYFKTPKDVKPMPDHNTSKSSSQECVGKHDRLDQNVSKSKNLNSNKCTGKSLTYVKACTRNDCTNNETRAIVGRYKPVLLTKMNKS